jgi:hypothetical protein
VRGEGRGGRRCGENGFPNAFDISKYFIIPKTQHAVAMIDEPSISDDVAFVSCVLAAVDFDDKPLFATNKVDDIGPDRLLADEFEPR